jgi:hypothetical protein
MSQFQPSGSEESRESLVALVVLVLLLGGLLILINFNTNQYLLGKSLATPASADESKSKK